MAKVLVLHYVINNTLAYVQLFMRLLVISISNDLNSVTNFEVLNLFVFNDVAFYQTLPLPARTHKV